jgi:hypothetical protein
MENVHRTDTRNGQRRSSGMVVRPEWVAASRKLGILGAPTQFTQLFPKRRPRLEAAAERQRGSGSRSQSSRTAALQLRVGATQDPPVAVPVSGGYWQRFAAPRRKVRKCPTTPDADLPSLCTGGSNGRSGPSAMRSRRSLTATSPSKLPIGLINFCAAGSQCRGGAGLRSGGPVCARGSFSGRSPRRAVSSAAIRARFGPYFNGPDDPGSRSIVLIMPLRFY